MGTVAGGAFAFAGVAGGALALAVLVAGAVFAGVSLTFSTAGAFAKVTFLAFVVRKRTNQMIAAGRNQPLRYRGHLFRDLQLISECKN